MPTQEERQAAAAYAKAVSTPPSEEAAAYIRARLTAGLHRQMPGCVHDEHGDDCAVLVAAVMKELEVLAEEGT